MIQQKYIPKRILIKEALKDLKSTYLLHQFVGNYDYFFVHLTKCGGTFLRDVLQDILSSSKLYTNNHELKLFHIPRHRPVILACRDPILRFESSFYSRIHRSNVKNKSENEYQLRYGNDINSYIESLMRDPQGTLKSAYFGNPMIGRFSTVSYWLKSKKVIDSRANDIIKLFRVEQLDDDLEEFSKHIGVTLFNLKNYKRYERPPNIKLTAINVKYLDFLHSFLDSEYDLVNHLRAAKGYDPYPH